MNLPSLSVNAQKHLSDKGVLPSLSYFLMQCNLLKGKLVFRCQLTFTEHIMFQRNRLILSGKLYLTITLKRHVNAELDILYYSNLCLYHFETCTTMLLFFDETSILYILYLIPCYTIDKLTVQATANCRWLLNVKILLLYYKLWE